MNWAQFDRLIEEALAEDIGPGDVTAEALIDEDLAARGVIEAGGPAVVCGLRVVERVFHRLDPQVRFEAHVKEGQEVREGQVVAEVQGLARALLGGERCALNLLQHLSGVATLTREFVRRVGGAKARILDTRKTTPLWRALEKYAVRVGGGTNHRMGLFDGVLIKNNHLALVGDIREAVRRAKERCSRSMRVQVEVRSREEAERALAAGTDALLLDNMTPPEMAEVVRMVGGQVFVEASGGVTLDNVAQVAATGVDAISVGALTHSAPAANFRLLIT